MKQFIVNGFTIVGYVIKPQFPFQIFITRGFNAPVMGVNYPENVAVGRFQGVGVGKVILYAKECAVRYIRQIKNESKIPG